MTKRPNFEIPAREDHTKQIYLITFEAPKATVILALVAKSVVRRKLKIWIWCSFPQPQLLIWAVLRKPDQEVRIYSSDLSQDERDAHIDSFKRDDDEAMITVCNDRMTSCGLNLHRKCCGTISFDCPTNRAIKDQQEGRFRGVGRPRTVISWTLSMAGTFNDRQVQNNPDKTVPKKSDESNWEIF
jgi:hypothetical protein